MAGAKLSETCPAEPFCPAWLCGRVGGGVRPHATAGRRDAGTGYSVPSPLGTSSDLAHLLREQMLCDLPKVTQLLIGRGGIRTQNILTPETMYSFPMLRQLQR